MGPTDNEETGGFRAGFVALAGKPNVGKSTLLNRILGEKLAIVTSKPQTTRDRLTGVYSDERCQLVFIDTPGLIEPRDSFNEYLLHEATEALGDADVAVHLVAVDDPEPTPPEVSGALTAVATPLWLAVNQVDRTGGRVDWDALAARLDLDRYERRFAISALTGEGVSDLLDALAEAMPESPPFYDPDQLSDRDLRWLVAERTREKVFELTQQEIPYGVAVVTEEFREREPPEKTYIGLAIHVERESQKGIVIGKGAAMLKQIGQAARREIEDLVGAPVYLDLKVKVSKNWKKDERALKALGYPPPRRKGRRR